MTIPLLLMTIGSALATTADSHFELASADSTATILVPESEPECVRLAAEDLAGDVRKITGRRPAIVGRLDQCSGHCVIVATVGRPGSAALLERFLPGAGELAGRWESYRVESVDVAAGPVAKALVIAGSDERGTMFGLYAFIEQYLGVDPLYFWADRPPAKRDRLAWPKVRLAAGEPTFRYRGWFINDEDLLSEWRLDGGARDIDYPYYEHVVSPRVARRIFEAMLRLGYNLVIPASFVDIRNPDEARLVDEASRRGLWVSMHHVEPMGVSGFGFQNYWRDRGDEVPFSFIRHPDKFEEIWREYAARWARYPNVVWQLGLRGIADRPVWVSDPEAPKTDEARGKLISDAMALQWEIVRSVDPRATPPATTTLWMEGSALHRQGFLRFPPDVAVIFADNSPGWELQADFYEVPREPGREYGIYYHHALWGTGPHLVQAVSPQKTHSIFRQAVERGSNYYAILNVSNVREFVLGVDASARMLRDFEGFDPEPFFSAWCRARFGRGAEGAERCYRRFFESFVIDREENARNLLDGEVVHRGRRFLGQMRTRMKQAKPRPWDDPERIGSLLDQVRTQRAAVEAAGADAGDVLALLEGTERAFFETNFVAQQTIMRGLLRWLESCLAAGLSLQDGDRAGAATHLEAALAGMETVRQGQALASRGRWEHWYRGDRKMNLAGAEQLTRDVLEAAY